MTEENVVKMDLSPAGARQLLAQLATDSSRVFFTDHAEDRMHERAITRAQVLRCLRHGTIVEGPARDTHGKWVMNMEVMSAGDVLRVVTALDNDGNGNLVLVITTYL